MLPQETMRSRRQRENGLVLCVRRGMCILTFSVPSWVMNMSRRIRVLLLTRAWRQAKSPLVAALASLDAAFNPQQVPWTYNGRDKLGLIDPNDDVICGF